MEHGQETITIVDENGNEQLMRRFFLHLNQRNSVNHMYFTIQ